MTLLFSPAVFSNEYTKPVNFFCISIQRSRYLGFPSHYSLVPFPADPLCASWHPFCLPRCWIFSLYHGARIFVLIYQLSHHSPHPGSFQPVPSCLPRPKFCLLCLDLILSCTPNRVLVSSPPDLPPSSPTFPIAHHNLSTVFGICLLGLGQLHIALPTHLPHRYKIPEWERLSGPA